MSEWTVVTALVVIIGLFATVGKPIINLNSNIVRLNMSLEALNEKEEKLEGDLEKHITHSHDSHQRIWEHNAAQDKRLDDHERRIDKLEKA